MSDKGWIKLYRDIQDNEIWLEDTPFNRRDAWIDLLLLANHKDNVIVSRSGKLSIKQGQVLTSVRKLSLRWHWGKDRTLSYLKLLESLEMIKRDTQTVNATLITIVNYGFYQHPSDSDKDTYKDTNKDTHKDSDKDTNKPQTRMIKNVKNDKNEKNIYNTPEEENVEDDLSLEELKKMGYIV